MIDGLQCSGLDKELKLFCKQGNKMSPNAIFCPHCGEDVPDTTESFCGKCGANLLVMVADIECSNCHKLIQDVDIYCRHCRYFVSIDC